jgi:dolichyl-diphosphooligosaccharide--protein glycosyltransferase
MRIPTTNETFTYTQETTTTADGELTMTLPYSTTGYDEYGPSNGYTNVSVRAEGPYRIQSALAADNDSIVQYKGQIQISEGRVNGDVSGEREVTLNRTNPFTNLSIGGGNESDGNTSGSSSLEPVTPTDGDDPTDGPTHDGASADDPSSLRAPAAAVRN